jgi:hypothetical protein
MAERLIRQELGLATQTKGNGGGRYPVMHLNDRIGIDIGLILALNKKAMMPLSRHWESWQPL